MAENGYDQEHSLRCPSCNLKIAVAEDDEIVACPRCGITIILGAEKMPVMVITIDGLPIVLCMN